MNLSLTRTGVVVSACFAGSVLAQPLPTDPSLVTGELDNGFRYIIKQHANPPGRAALWMHVSTGSLNETDEQRGLAHYLEHMAFNGSPNFPPGSVVPFFESLGMTFGRDQNAFTSFDQTTYQLTLPDVKPETFDKGFLFFADVAGRLSLDPKEIDEERQVILEERRTRLSAQQRVQDYFFERIAPGSIFGERLPIGTEKTLMSVQQNNFKDYYNKFYVPSNMTLLIVADADPAMIAEHVKKSFGGGERKAPPADQGAGLKAQTEYRVIVPTDPELRDASVGFYTLSQPKPPVTTEEQVRAKYIEDLGSGAFNRRLGAKVNEGKVRFLSGGASAMDLFNALRFASVTADGEPDKWKEMFTDLATELQRARVHGFSEREIDDVKADFIAGAEQAVKTESTRPARVVVGMMNSMVAQNEPIMSAAQRLELVKKYMPAITAAEVSARFAQVFDPANCTFTFQMPSGPAAKVQPPTEAEALSFARTAIEVKPAADVLTDRPTQLLSEKPGAATVADAQFDEPTAVASAWLSNGVRVHHRFMDIRKDNVTVSITLAGGEIEETAQNHGITQVASLAWSRPATSKLTSTNVRDLMVGKNVTVGGGAGGDNLTLNVSGSPEHLEHGMQLAYLMLTDPVIEQASFDQWKTEQLQGIEARKIQPFGVLAENMMDMVLPAGEVRQRLLEKADVDRQSPAAAQAWLARILKTAPIEVCVVGDISKDRAMELVATYVGSIAQRDRISGTTLDSLRTIQRPKGPLAKSATVATVTPQAVVMAGFFGTDIDQVRESRLMNVASKIMSTRMNKKIREEEQLVYGIGFQSRPAAEYPGYGMAVAAAPTDPAKAARLADRIDEMLTEFANNGPTEDELTVAKRQIANELDMQMKQPDFWMPRLAELTYRDRKLSDIVDAPAAFQAFTAQDVKDNFAKFCVPDRKLRVIVTPLPPEPKAEQPAAPKPQGAK